MNNQKQNSIVPYLTKANVLEFLNISSAFYFLIFIILRFLVRLLEAPEITSFMILKIALMFSCAVIVVITGLLMLKKKSITINITQLIFAFILLAGSSKCVVKTGIEKNPVIVILVFMVLCAMGVILTRISISCLKFKEDYHV